MGGSPRGRWGPGLRRALRAPFLVSTHDLSSWNLYEKMDSLLTLRRHQGSMPTEVRATGSGEGAGGRRVPGRERVLRCREAGGPGGEGRVLGRRVLGLGGEVGREAGPGEGSGSCAEERPQVGVLSVSPTP